jgi:hypothetical protein
VVKQKHKKSYALILNDFLRQLFLRQNLTQLMLT